MTENNISIKRSVTVSIFTALTVIGGYIAIPIGPVPIVLSNFMILLTGLLLGKKQGTAVAVTYLLLGLLGLPVFSGGTSGFAHLAGPTGGYLLAYIPAAFLTGAISDYGKRSLLKNLTALFTGALTIYLLGVPWLKYFLDIEWGKAIVIGMLPFIPGDLLKITAALLIGSKMYTFFDNSTLSERSEKE